jgi:hypothetical protein
MANLREAIQSGLREANGPWIVSSRLRPRPSIGAVIKRVNDAIESFVRLRVAYLFRRLCVLLRSQAQRFAIWCCC